MRSKFGVGIGPPNVLDAPKPVSSVMMSNTFGAPLGATTPVGKSGFDSLALRPTIPPNGASGTGKTGEPPVGDVSAGAAAGAAGAFGGSAAISHPKPIADVSANPRTTNQLLFIERLLSR